MPQPAVEPRLATPEKGTRRVAAARRVAQLRGAPAFGISAEAVRVAFAKVHAHVHGTIAALAPNDSAARFTALGVRVIAGHAEFRDPHTIVVGETVDKETIVINETMVTKEPIVVTKSKPTESGSHRTTRSTSHESTRSASHKSTRSTSHESTRSTSHKSTRSTSCESSHIVPGYGLHRDR